MDIRIAGIANDSIVDGPGLRLTVFTQGCPHHCPGCHNPQSHDYNNGTLVDTQSILRDARDNVLLDGITLSGGEPFVQPEACTALAKGAHEIGLSVWCYSGYTFEQLLKGTSAQIELLKNIDVLVDGPFIMAERTLDARFRGSANQRILNIPASLKASRAILLNL